ncbi:MAG TPA: RNA polymerase sigma factor [Ktedonobacterales bacterium]
MEPSTRPYNPSSQRVSRARGAGPAKRQQESAATQAAPAATRTAARAAKPRARRAATPRVDPVQTSQAVQAVEVAERPQPVDERTPHESDAPGLADGALLTEAGVPSSEQDEVIEASEPSPLIGVDDFEDIFTRFQTPITNFIYRLVGNREQAFDLAQDVFVKAYRALSGGATIQAGALSSWLYRIASNTATDALRRRRLISWLPLSLFNDDRGVGAGMPGAENGFGQQALSEEHLASAMGAFTSGYDGGRFEQRVADREIVERVLKRLPEKYAACLLLYEHEGFSCAEIADVLHVTPSAVKMRLMRARERFISIYQQEMEGRQ